MVRGGAARQLRVPATAKDLDAIEATTADRARGNDGHTVWVNSRGLALLGRNRGNAGSPGGKIDRDASGAPTGSFADRAAIFVADKIPRRRVEEQAALTAAELKKMSALASPR